jgi:hypothetical protein
VEQSMELDELRQKWLEHDRKLEISIRLNRQLLRDAYTRKARFALWRLGAMLAAGCAILLGIVGWLGLFIHQNQGMPEFVWPAVALEVFAIATTVCLNRQIVLALRIDYDQPVAVIQKQIERLRRARIRYIQAVCLGTTLTWAPIFMVVMKAAFGVDVWLEFDRTWLVTNVLIGLAVIPVGIWLARQLASRLNQKFLNDLAGYNLNAASRFLADLARFEEEPQP